MTTICTVLYKIKVDSAVTIQFYITTKTMVIGTFSEVGAKGKTFTFLLLPQFVHTVSHIPLNKVTPACSKDDWSGTSHSTLQ